MSHFVQVSQELFSSIGDRLLKKEMGATIDSRRFRSFFGASPFVCLIIWNTLGSKIPLYSKPEYLLWAMMFLKIYSTEHVHCSIAQCDEKTFRKWSWTFVKLIADLQVIKWGKRLVCVMEDCVYYTVDGTDCRIYEPEPFSPIWFSYKFKGPGLRYEVATSIYTGDIVWVHRAFPCGLYPDVRIFREGMKMILNDGEKVITDGGYPDECCIVPVMVDDTQRQMFKRIRARQETTNRRLKQFCSIGNCFRHDVSLHSFSFHAVANITQLMIELEEPLFSL